MKAALLADWLAALRSGKYKQIKHKLHGPDGYCCLGVLCEVAESHGYKVVRGYDGRIAGAALGVQPDALLAELRPHDHGNVGGSALQLAVFLTHLNDTYDKDFDQIADYIETRLKPDQPE